MSLVFRTDQTTPLTNDQVDNNFKYLRDQINLKYSTSDFTSANISLKLNTPGVGQSTYDLAQSNALNAWTMRGMAPLATMPTDTNKESIVSRNASGDIYVGSVHGNVIGNATTATTATTAGKLTTAITINGVTFDGSANITVQDNTKVPLSGGTMTGKLNLVATAQAFAPLNLGIAAPDQNAKSNGDVWSTTSGVYYHINNVTRQIASVESPTFTGIPKAPGFDGNADQIITLSHLSTAVGTLNDSINLKANSASPSFSGIPTAPTAASTSNSTQIANTAFVKTAINSASTSLTASYQSYTDAAVTTLSDSVNVLLNAKASLNSPVLTGTPTAPTAAVGTNNTQIATTAFTATALASMQASVNAAITALQDLIASTRPVPVGTVFYTVSSSVPYGYLEANGQVVSQATYNDLWVKLGSPATTAGDPAGTYRLPDYRGEFIRAWDHGRGVDNGRLLNSLQGENIGSHIHDFYDVYAVSADQPGNFNMVNGVPTMRTGTVDTNSGLRDADGALVYQYYYMQNGVDGDNDGGAYAFKNRTLPSLNTSELRPRNVALMPIIKW